MAGLFGLDEDAQLGLLTAALAAMSARGVRPGTALAQGGLLGLGAMQNAKAGRADAERQRREDEFRQMQMEDYRRKIAEQQEQKQSLAAIEQGAPRIGPQWNAPTPGASPQVSEAFGVPAAKPQTTEFDPAAQYLAKAHYYNNAGRADLAEKQIEMANKLRVKYGMTPVVGIGADGQPVNFVQSEYGDSKQLPIKPVPKFSWQDTGSALVPRNEYDTNPQAIPKTMNPGEVARLQLAREQFGYQQGRDRVADAREGGGVKPQWNASTNQWMYPPSAEYPQGRAVTPEGVVTKQDRGEAAREESAKTRASIVLAKVDESLNLIGDESMLRPRTGLTGSVAGMIPGTGAYDLRRTVETIKAQLGFGELQAMREISPTGGALGQVAVQELNMLQATIANLDPNQSPEQITQNLKQVRTHMQRWRAAVRQATGGGAGATGEFAGSPEAPTGKRWVYNPKTGKLEAQ